MTKESDVTGRGGGETDRTDERKKEKVFACYVTQELKGKSSGLWLISNSARQNKSLVEREGDNLTAQSRCART